MPETEEEFQEIEAPEYTEDPGEGELSEEDVNRLIEEQPVGDQEDD